MTLTAKNTNLSEGQVSFRNLIEVYPWLAKYWDWETRECAYDDLKMSMGTMSHGERIIAQFFLGVWTHNDHEFDILEAASTLDNETRHTITNWLNAPFWP